MSFKKWLLQQKDRDDPVGDLARDANNDEHTPSSIQDWKKYFNRIRACEGAHEALERAVREYKGRSTSYQQGALSGSS